MEIAIEAAAAKAPGAVAVIRIEVGGAVGIAKPRVVNRIVNRIVDGVAGATRRRPARRDRYAAVSRRSAPLGASWARLEATCSGS